MSTTTDSVRKILRIHLPGAVDGAVNLAVGETVFLLCRDVLQIPAPADYATNWDSWLNDASWVEHHSLIIDGALARMYGEPSKPYSNVELAKAHADLYAQAMANARVVASSKAVSSDGFTRLMNNLRAKVPGMRDDAIQQELFNTIDHLQRHVLQGTPPAHGASPNAWLSSADYDQYFRLLAAGTLTQILTQPGKPWTDVESAKLQNQIYADECGYARADTNAVAAPMPHDAIIDNLRVDLPGSKDSAMKLALRNVVIEACRVGYIWSDSLPYEIDPLAPYYELPTPGCDIVEVLGFYHQHINTNGAVIDGRRLLLPRQTSTWNVEDEPLVIKMILAPLPTVDLDAPEAWIPDDLWTTHHQMLLDGVRATMMLQPGKPYSNAALAQYHGKRFRAALATSYDAVKRKKVYDSRGWRFPRFA